MSLKKIVMMVTAVLVLALLSAFWWISQYDYNRLKPIIAEQVRAATDRDIDIQGDLRLKVGLAPTLTTGPVKLRNAAWGSEPNMLTTEGIELQLSLLPLLRKKGVFKRLVLIKPVALVEQNADGTQNNWEFDKKPAKDTPAPETPSEPVEFSLEHAEIKDGQLRILNHPTGDATTLHIGDFVLEKQRGSLPLKMKLKGAYNETAFSLEGDINLFRDLLYTSKDWAFDLAFKAKQTEVTLAGRLQRPSGDAPPRLEVAVNGPQLDVRPWLVASQDAPAPVKKNTDRVFSDAPLPLEILHKLDLQADIEIEELLLPHIALNKVKTTLRIDGGRFEAGPARAVAGGGDYLAHFKIDAQAKPPRMTADLKIAQMNAGLMLKELGQSNVMEGVLDFRADLAGQGASMAQLMGGLNGHAMLVSGEGRLGQGFFSLFSRDLTNQLLELFNPSESRESTTPIECLVIRLDSTKGKVDLSQVVWVTPDAIVVGGGQIDLATEKIDIGIQPTPKRGSVSLGILTKPFRLGGTLGKPAMNIDPTATALTAGRIAGGMLFGPVGIAMAFTSISGNAANPCLEAAQTAEKGVVPEEKGFLENIGDKLRFWKKE